MSAFLEGVPHAPDARSWEVFNENWPEPEGTEYLGRKLEEHEEAHSDDGWTSPFVYATDMKKLVPGDSTYQRLKKAIDLADRVNLCRLVGSSGATEVPIRAPQNSGKISNNI